MASDKKPNFVGQILEGHEYYDSGCEEASHVLLHLEAALTGLAGDMGRWLDNGYHATSISIFFRTPFHEYFDFFRSVGCVGKVMAKACRITFRRVLQTTTGQSEVQRVAVPRNLALS